MLKTKEIICGCGHKIQLNQKKIRCVKCGKTVFYDHKEAVRHRWSNIYTLGMLLSAVTFLTYLFIEMIATPILSF